MIAPASVSWPNRRRFAFTIFDDTDWTTLANGPLVYEFLTDLGFRVTKSVWPVAPARPTTVGGLTCADPDYLHWVLRLQEQGHEIGFHNACDHSSTRPETLAAIERFRELFGHDPKTGADHAGNREALYAGPARLSGVRARAYGLAQRVVQPNRPAFSGEQPASRYFWGDLCRDRVRYWRGFTFSDTNTLRACPSMPYHDPRRHYVNAWFASTDAPRCADLVERLQPRHLDRLEDEGGACILYTHLGLDAVVGGELDPGFVAAMTDLAGRDGWFAPTHDILDHLRAAKGLSIITATDQRRLERRWMADRIRSRSPLGPRSRVQTVGDPP